MMSVMPGPSGPPPGQPGGYSGTVGYQPRFGYAMKPRMPPPAGGSSNLGYGGMPTSTMKFVPNQRPDDKVGGDEGDGKKPRKSQMRRTVDYSSSFIRMMERRTWQRDFRDKRALQPDVLHQPNLLPPMDYLDNPANAATTKFVKTATNKMRCPIFTLDWTPEGRRLITGASSGEFTLWNGLTFNFETILQAHDSSVRAMKWSHNDTWMVTGDHGGYIKYWQSNMNNVKMFQAHKEAVRSVSFAPTDQKFASCSDDGTVRIWDFFTCNEERVLRGHGSDVKCVDWHPTKGLLASGSKDNQQPVKIWEPKTGAVLCTLHAHKSTVMDIKWNANGNWLLTASRDHLLKLFDIRNTKEEVQTFRGHKKEASTIAWHPVHENVFASGGSDGSIMFWNVGSEKEVGVVEQAHESIVWALSWHPVGHILCSGSNDHTCKFWTRNRPGDTMRDKYNLNTNPTDDEVSTAENAPMFSSVIPGMAPEDRVEAGPTAAKRPLNIPGLDSAIDDTINPARDDANKKKVPYSKPIPKSFQASWNDTQEYPPAGPSDGPGPFGGPPQLPPPHFGMGHPPGMGPMPPHDMEPGVLSLQELQRQATAVVAFGNVYPVIAGSNLFMSVLSGEGAVKEVLRNECML